MNTPTKAMLLSAFVCPGAGQLYLKRYAMAAVLLLITAIALVMLIVPAIAAANTIAERLVSGDLGGGSDLLGEIQSATAEASGSSAPATIALLGAWLVGIVHAWLVTRKRDLS